MTSSSRDSRGRPVDMVNVSSSSRDSKGLQGDLAPCLHSHETVEVFRSIWLCFGPHETRALQKDLAACLRRHETLGGLRRLWLFPSSRFCKGLHVWPSCRRLRWGLGHLRHMDSNNCRRLHIVWGGLLFCFCFCAGGVYFQVVA